MRIGLLSKQSSYGGGSGQYSAAIATALARQGHEIDLFTLGSSPEEPSTHRDVNVITVAKPRPYLVTFETLYYSLLTRRVLDPSEYDVLHGTLMPASPVALPIDSIETPIVVTSHGTSLGEVRSHKLEVPTDYLKKLFFHPTNVGMDMMTAPRVDKVIAISSDAESELVSRYPASETAVRLIHHGVDTEEFAPDGPTHYAVSDGKTTLLHVGRLVSRKHVDLAIEGVAEADNPDLELLIAGNGQHRDRLQKRSKKLDIEGQVDFLGYVPQEELPSLYASADGFVFLSRYEGFGLTFLEAMASGTPVIGTSVGGFPDIATHEVDSLFVEREPSEVSQAINRVARDGELKDSLAKSARQTAEEYTWDRTAKETEQIYRDLV